ncbi:mitochondrial glyco protein [Laetiporus sulphureus 93-53]|uniref:Mitochondrial glyco protein n=1 Tax=Laetiporus sulphureus 93-53 TaxID=1314785 RepID=A0A165EH40_9APHY|nr:mitochondrial glyco protein [Laetiporus sulphureus 93-53]KZT07041.1 mitochondrial glyco protein [Laetiporus sulphureus 93-53]
MSAIRALRHISLSSSRAFAVRSGARAFSRAAMPVFASRGVPASMSAARTFSASARACGEGASDVTLAQKLSEELQYEKEASTTTEPEFLKVFKAQSVWEIEDTAGNDEIALTRKFGNETIRLMFSIADIQNEHETEFEENEENEETADEEEPIHSYPIRCSFSVTKSTTEGALTIDAMCQEGAFIVDNISFYTDAKLGTDLTAEADWKRRGLYIGPQFDTLDVAVQEEFEKFLQERGINESLALFIPEYAEYKEQKEYVSWLKNVKTFVEA